MKDREGTKRIQDTTVDLEACVKEWAGQRALSGSDSGYFTLALMNQVWRSLQAFEGAAEWVVDLSRGAAQHALKNIAPRDAAEGMLAAQMLAAHDAAMECFRRAALPELSAEARQQNLSQANKLMRSYAALLEALDKHRGKGRQTVRVEHVHVNDGGQAIIGNVARGEGAGGGNESDEQPHAKGLAHALEPQVSGFDARRSAVPVARDGQGAL